MEPEKEIPLSRPMRRSWLTGDERSAVYRRGDVVVRDANPWTPSVHSFLRHLESEGFEAAPRLVGSGFDEQGREALQFIEGEVLHPGAWSEDGAYELGHLVRKLHDAAASFKTTPKAGWPPWFGKDLGDSSSLIISHCDLAPWNIVSRDRMPVAFIDWEYTGPVDPLVEFAQVCWLNAQLHGEDVAEV